MTVTIRSQPITASWWLTNDKGSTTDAAHVAYDVYMHRSKVVAHNA